MNTKTINIIGISVGTTWLVVALYIGYGLFMQLLAEFGDTFAAFSLFYLLGWVGAIFLGRSILERILTFAFELESDVATIWIDTTMSPDRILESPTAPLGAVAAYVIIATGLNVEILDERDTGIFDTTANVEWAAK